jgi:hypothetical protein
VCGLWCGFKIFPVTVSVKWSVPNNASQQCFQKITNFGMAQVVIPKSAVTTCQVRKCTVFIEYVQCIFKHLETCMNVQDLLAINDFIYSDGFTHTLWWISAYFFIGLNVVVHLPSKDIVGNDVTSCFFVCLMINLRHDSVHTFRQLLDFSYCAYLSSCL